MLRYARVKEAEKSLLKTTSQSIAGRLARATKGTVAIASAATPNCMKGKPSPSVNPWNPCHSRSEKISIGHTSE